MPVAGITVLHRNIYLCGGVSKSLTVFTKQCEAFDVDTLNWSPVAALPTEVHNCAAASLNGKVYVSGGQVQARAPARTITDQLLCLTPG